MADQDSPRQFGDMSDPDFKRLPHPSAAASGDSSPSVTGETLPRFAELNLPGPGHYDYTGHSSSWSTQYSYRCDSRPDVPSPPDHENGSPRSQASTRFPCSLESIVNPPESWQHDEDGRQSALSRRYHSRHGSRSSMQQYSHKDDSDHLLQDIIRSPRASEMSTRARSPLQRPSLPALPSPESCPEDHGGMSPKQPDETRFDQRDDRHEYDLEEQFAVCFLRWQLTSNIHRRWKVVEQLWMDLFPLGQPRRTDARLQPSGKVLTPNYVQRSSSGLQCKYYRIRAVLGVGQVRQGNGETSRRQDEALREIERRLAGQWYHGLNNSRSADWSCYGLQPGMNTRSPEHKELCRAAWRQHNAFWRKISAVPNVRLYD